MEKQCQINVVGVAATKNDLLVTEYLCASSPVCKVVLHASILHTYTHISLFDYNKKGLSN